MSAYTVYTILSQSFNLSVFLNTSPLPLSLVLLCQTACTAFKCSNLLFHWALGAAVGMVGVMMGVLLGESQIEFFTISWRCVAGTQVSRLCVASRGADWVIGPALCRWDVMGHSGVGWGCGCTWGREVRAEVDTCFHHLKLTPSAVPPLNNESRRRWLAHRYAAGQQYQQPYPFRSHKIVSQWSPHLETNRLLLMVN